MRYLALVLVLAIVLADGYSQASTGTSLGEDGGEGSNAFTGLSQTPEANLFTGAMGMAIPIKIPPGRKLTTPDLKLSYSSAAGHTPFGYGWSLPLGTLERSTKYGAPNCVTNGGALDHSKEFVLNLAGGTLELQHISGDLYRAKTDEAYLEATVDPVNNRWTVHDRAGMTYRFGWTTNERLFKGDDVLLNGSSTCRFTSVWALTEVEDPNGNSVEIHYFKNFDTLYPDEILYGGNPGAGVDHPFKVSFGREARPYQVRSHRSGHPQRMIKRIKNIQVWYKPATIYTDFELIRTYQLDYQDVPENGRSLLTSVSGDLLPTQTFEYSTSDFQHRSINDWPASGSFDWRLRYRANSNSVRRSLMDMNGDGMIDWVNTETGNNHRWHIYLGTPDGLETGHINWSHPLGGTHMNDLDPDENNVWIKYETIDLTGDGIPDFADARSDPWKVYPGACSDTACGFDDDYISWDAPGTHIRRDRNLNGNSTWVTVRNLMDINGDGRPDLVTGGPDDDEPMNVYINTGTGFSYLEDFEAQGSLTRVVHSIGSHSGLTTRDFFDWNGDGLPDRIEARYDKVALLNPDGSINSLVSDDCSHAYIVCSSNPGPTAGVLRVYLNTGTGFENSFNVPVSTAVSDEYFGVRRRINRDVLDDFLDMNGDRLPDRVEVQSDGSWSVLANQNRQLKLTVNGSSVGGDPWSGISGAVRHTEGDGSSVTTIDVFDWNGDGFMDRIQSQNPPWRIQVGEPVSGPEIAPGLLVKAHNGLGGVTEVRYAASSLYDNTGEEDEVPDLPFMTWVTTATRSTDGLCDPPPGVDPFDSVQNPCIGQGHEQLKWNDYQGGRFDPVSREFRGFRIVTETDGDGNVREVTYSQDAHTRGKVETDRLYAGSIEAGHLLREQNNLWQTQTSLGRMQVFLAEQRSEEFAVPDNPTLTQCSLNRTESPDDYGRSLKTCSLSCSAAPATPDSCDNPVDGQIDTITEWANPNAGFFVRERPSRVLTQYKEAGGSIEVLTEKWFRYDGAGTTQLPEGQVEQGNVRYAKSRLDQSYAGAADDPEVFTEYDPLGNVIEVKNPLGHRWFSDYTNEFFRLYPTLDRAPQVNGVNHWVFTTTDLRFGKPLSVNNENGNATRYAYDGLGRLVCEAKPGASCAPGGTSSAEYAYVYATPGGSLEDRHSYVETRVRAPESSDPAHPGFVAHRSYTDAMQRERFMKSQRVVEGDTGLRWVVHEQSDYDTGGRLAAVYGPYLESGGSASFPPPSAPTLYDYDLNGEGVMDPLGRPHRVTPPDGNASIRFYDGVRTRVFDLLGNELRTTKDDLGREVRKELFDNGERKLWFDYDYDGMGNVLATTTSGDTSTTLRTVYDKLGREIEVIDPNSGSWKFGYDAAGNLLYENDPMTGQHVQSTYDELNRAVRRCTFSSDVYEALVDDCGSGELESSYTYDEESELNHGVGKLTRVDDLNGYESFVYDERGRITEQTREILGISASMEFRYNEADRIDRITYPDGENVHHVFDETGQLVELNAGERVYLADVQYDLFGRPTHVEHGNGVVDERSYHGPDQNFRLAGIRTYNGQGNHLHLGYTYNDIGKIELIDDLRDASGELSNQFTYSYDGLGRLVEADWLSNGSASEPHDDAYDYNSLGNIVLKGGYAFSYGENGAGPNQVTSYAAKLMSYDANGQRESKGVPSDGQEYTYDKLGRVTRVLISDGEDVEYRYDYAGRRIAKRVDQGPWQRYFSNYAESKVAGGGRLTKYYFAEDVRIAERYKSSNQFVDASATGAIELWSPPPMLVVGLSCVILVLLIGPGRRPVRVGVAVAPTRALGSTCLMIVTCIPLSFFVTGCKGAVISHYHLDHLGSTQVITNEQGSIFRQIRYEPYGDVRGRFSGQGNPVDTSTLRYSHEFTGYESEIESGLQYAGSRYYDPELAQFLSLDPERQFASPYAYSAGDPVGGVDPDGEYFHSLAVFAVLALLGTQTYLNYQQTGDIGEALKMTAIQAGIAVAAAAVGYFVLGPLLGPVIAVLPPLAQGAFGVAIVGVSVYAAVKQLEDRNLIGAIFSLGSAIRAAHGLSQAAGAAGTTGKPIQSDDLSSLPRYADAGTTATDAGAQEADPVNPILEAHEALQENGTVEVELNQLLAGENLTQEQMNQIEARNTIQLTASGPKSGGRIQGTFINQGAQVELENATVEPVVTGKFTSTINSLRFSDIEGVPGKPAGRLSGATCTTSGCDLHRSLF